MVKPRGMLFMGFGWFVFWKKKKRLILSLSLEHFCCQMCLLWYLLYLWYYLCVSIHTYIHTYIYIYIYFISIKRFFLPTFWAENTFCLFFLLTVPRCVKSRPGSVIDSLLCIPFFFFSACFKAVCGYVSYKNWRSSCGFSQVGRNWKTTHICWDRKCALRLPTNWSFVLATCDKQTEQHPWRFGDFEAAI